LQEQADDLQAKAIEAEAKAHRLRQQRRAILQKMKAMGDREETNIEASEAEEEEWSQASFGSLDWRYPMQTGSG